MYISIAEWNRKHFIAVRVVVVPIATADSVIIIIQYSKQWQGLKKMENFVHCKLGYKTPVKVLRHV